MGLEDCVNNCTHHGDCKNGQCFCFQGYLHGSENDCSRVFLDEDNNKETWDGLRFTCAGLWGVLFIIMAIGAYYGVSIRKFNSFNGSTKGEATLTVVNVRRYLHSAGCVMAFTQLLYLCLDPDNLYYETKNGKVPPVVIHLLAGTPYYLGVVRYSAILFHWVELYHVAVRILKKEDMLKKINVNYKGQHVTVETIVNQLKFLRKMRIPYLMVVVSIVVLQVIDSILTAKRNRTVTIIFYPYVLIIWMILSCGFIVYGRKMTSLMPDHCNKHVKRWTSRLTIFSIIVTSLLFLGIVLSYTVASRIGNSQLSGTATRQITAGMIIPYLILVDVSATTILFFQPNRKWPFLFQSEHYSRSNSNSNSYNSNINTNQLTDIDLESGNNNNNNNNSNNSNYVSHGNEEQEMEEKNNNGHSVTSEVPLRTTSSSNIKSNNNSDNNNDNNNSRGNSRSHYKKQEESDCDNSDKDSNSDSDSNSNSRNSKSDNRNSDMSDRSENDNEL